MADGLHERVNADLAEGRLWKARDRLQGARRMDPTNQWILETLGEVYFRMGDLPEAGRAWFLTARTGPDWERAEAAFYARYGNRPQDTVVAIRVRGEIDDYPEPVQERLRTLQRRLKAEGRTWEPRRGRRAEPYKRGRVPGIVRGIIFIGILLVVISIFIIGLDTAITGLTRSTFGAH